MTVATVFVGTFVIISLALAFVSVAFNADKEKTIFGELRGRIVQATLELGGAAVVLYAVSLPSF